MREKYIFEKQIRRGSQLRTVLLSTLFLLIGGVLLFGMGRNSAALPPSKHIQEIWEMLDKASAELASITVEDFPQGQFYAGWPLGFWKLTEFKEIAGFQEKVRDREGLRKTAKRAKKGSEDIRIWHDGVWLAWIAKHQVQTGDHDGAKDTVHEALKRASKHGIENFPDMWLEDVIEVQALTGQVDLALTTIQWLEEFPEKALSLARVARSYAQDKHDSKRAIHLFEEAIRESRKISDDKTRARVLLKIAQFQRQAGKNSDALLSTRYLREFLDSQQPGERIMFLLVFANLEKIFGNRIEAKNFIGEAVRLSEQFPEKAMASSELARIQFELGDREGGLASLVQVRKEIMEIQDNPVRASNLVGLARRYLHRGEMWRVQPILMEALDLFMKYDVRHDRFVGVKEVASVLSDLPNLTKISVKVIEDALSTMPEEYAEKESTLRALSCVQAAAGEIQEAERTRMAIGNDEFERARTAQCISANKVRVGNIHDALRWVSSLDHPYSRTLAYIGLAQGLMRKIR